LHQKVIKNDPGWNCKIINETEEDQSCCPNINKKPKPSFEANLTVERALDLYGMLWGLLDKKVRKQNHDLEQMGNAKNDDLSIGQRRRVQVAT
jgi:hypothetical protein